MYTYTQQSKMSSHADERPSIRDANLALASLLTALKQSGNSPAAAAHNGAHAAQSSPAAQQYQHSVVQSSPAYTPAASSVANGAPTPSAQTAADLSELGTYELLLQLGAHLGVMGASQNASTGVAGQGSATQAGPSRGPGVGMVGGKAPKNRSMHKASTTAAAESSSMVYHPQPTRSGRVPQAPSNNSTADPSTVLFNDFFDFPSDDEEEDPDFDPNDPMVDFWGDLLAKERADGDVTENEGDWGGGNTQGITGDEFAREIAMLTSTLDDPLPTPDSFDVGGRGRTTSSATPPTLRSSPRRRATSIPVAQNAPQLPSPRRRRRGLSPVPEDPAPHASTSAFQYDPRPDLHEHLPLHPLLNYQQPVDPKLQLPLPPPSTTSTATTSIADEAEAEVPVKRSRKRKYTPEESAERRKEQEKARQAKRRKTEKQRKEEREKQVQQLEVENKELKEKCAALEERVRDLEWRLREKRRTAGGVGHDADDEDGGEEESDGGEYQVQSSEESSSEEDSDSEAQDAAAYIGAVAAELDQLQQVTSPPQPSPAPYQPPAPPPVGLNLANISQDALAQLLSIVHNAAKQQGISLANSPAS